MRDFKAALVGQTAKCVRLDFFGPGVRSNVGCKNVCFVRQLPSLSLKLTTSGWRGAGRWCFAHWRNMPIGCLLVGMLINSEWSRG